MSFENLNLHYHFDIFFLGVDRSDPVTNSTANHLSYNDSGRLHSPWCKPTLSIAYESIHLSCLLHILEML